MLEIIKGKHYKFTGQIWQITSLGQEGHWYLFAKKDDESQEVWCELLASDLHLLEELK